MERELTSYKTPKGEGRILVIDGDPGFRSIIKLALNDQGYLVQTYGRPTGIHETLRIIQPELIILDPWLAGNDTPIICEDIREVTEAPIIAVSSRNDMKSKIEAFVAGADDYLVKPFNIEELRMRTWAAIRRSSYQRFRKPNILETGSLTIDFNQRLVLVNNEEVQLSPTEYRLLETLARSIDTTVDAEVLLARVWGPEYRASEASPTLHMTISRLRKKLRDNARSPKLIINKPGMGYMMPQHPPNLRTANKIQIAKIISEKENTTSQQHPLFAEKTIYKIYRLLIRRWLTKPYEQEDQQTH
jgi:two-component system, OmpR family, KDP operon response regulator KdpE